jgi:tRNA(fMet)-specific endonuclease VapC
VAVLIDASILIEAERGRLTLDAHVARHADEESFRSVIAAAELLHGVHRAIEPRVRTKRSAFVEGILERFPVLDVDLSCASAHAQIWAELRATGTIIGHTTCGSQRPASPMA